MYRIEIDMDGEDWDRELARLGGHPWQSAAWGDAQREIEGTEDHRLKLSDVDETIQMVRVETRRLPGVGKLAWIRRGPAGPRPADRTQLHPDIVKYLSAEGYIFAVANPYSRHTGPLPATAPYQTVWIDLTVGRSRLWGNLMGNLRRGVSRAQRGGVTVTMTRDPRLVSRYFELCQEISRAKGFELRTSEAFLNCLLNAPTTSDTEAQLFIASYDNDVAAGAFVYRCGTSIHYMSGTSDRAFAAQRPGDILHWSVIEWALNEGCTRYDLEGIDPAGNPGTYNFKRKLGGEEVALAGRWLTPLNTTGRILAPLAHNVLNSRFAELSPLTRLIRKRQPANQIEPYHR